MYFGFNAPSGTSTTMAREITSLKMPEIAVLIQKIGGSPLKISAQENIILNKIWKICLG